jgi:DNA-binding NtrC family response regulator
MNTDEIARLLPTLAEVEKEHILHAMRVLDGNKRLAARALGISEKTVYNKLNRYAEQEVAAS